MEKRDLIQKWLSEELTSSEMGAFKKLPESDSYIKISNAAKLFKDDSYNVSSEYSKLNAIIAKKRESTLENDNKISEPKTIPMFNTLKPLMQIAAVFLVGLGVYFGPFYGSTKTVSTAQNQKTVKLPDASLVALNSTSQIQYEKSDFKNKRVVNLVGEADFDVKEGSIFEVVTWSGKIEDIVGTKFSVKQRANSFEVICKEGELSFNYKGKIVRLPAGKKLNIINGKIVEAKSKLA